jgi:hypothetical protein
MIWVVTWFRCDFFSSPGVYAWVRDRRRYSSPINGALKLTAASTPRGKPMGYRKAIQIEHHDD